MEFETFKDDLESYIYENMDLGDKLADKLNDITEGSWDNRTYHYQPDFVALNVKGKGMGDYSKVSDILSEDDYIAELGRSIQYFFDDWERIFKEDFGLILDVMGRSGGWWGFKADDLTDFRYVLQLNEDKVKELYSKMEAESIDEYTDFYELFDTDDSDDFFEGDFFDFREDFAVMVNNFVNDVKATSDHFEGDEYNNGFRTIYESAPTSSKNKLKESEEETTRTRIEVRCPFGYGYGYLKELVEDWNQVEPNHKLESSGKGVFKAYDMPIPLVQDVVEHFNGGESGPSYDIVYKVYDSTYSRD